MTRHAKHGVLVLSDADIRVRPDYLRSMVAPLVDPKVGLTTCLYRGRGYHGLPSVIESLLINTDSIPMFVTAEWVQGLKNAYGASIAFRREALDAIGGFPALADYLADDNLLGERIKQAGHTVELLPYVVETILDSTTLGDVWRHQLRWARTYRLLQPAGWFASVITHAVPWGLAALVASGGSLAGWTAFTAAIAVRLGTLRAIMRMLRERDTPRHLWMVPLKDLGFSAVWIASWLGQHVEWSGRRLRIQRDGRMVPVGDGAPAVPPTFSPGETTHAA
jgi:ceramide glucosyltransferase